jgi:cation diffusion facilitator CzcD-associated flavoprotein CzcO
MPGDMPWPEVKVGNANHADTAVLIIGAGISGICTAIDLVKRNNCRNFVIVEKSSGVGGTWHDNKYPGCCCDVWSALYSLSYEQNSDWTREYPGQEEILAYLVGVAQKYKIYEHVRFNTSVENAVWNDETKRWHVDVKTAEGSKDAEFSPAYQIKTDFLVSAVGQLNQPKWPEIDGIENFVGKKMHSARWDWSYDLQDKKIAILGNGIPSPPHPAQNQPNNTILTNHSQVAHPPKSPPKSPK